MSVKISVVIPSFNSEDFILETLYSIQKQTFKHFEVLIVDDYSTDESVKLIQDFCVHDNRFKLLRNVRKKGVSGAANTAILQAQGKYILRCDADDIAFPERFERLFEFMENSSVVDLAGSFMQTFGREERIWNAPVSSDEILASMIFFNPIFQPTIIAKRHFFNANLYDENIKTAEDFELWERKSTRSKFQNIPEVLVKYRLYSHSTSSIYSTETILNSFEINLRAFEKLNIGLNEREKKIYFEVINGRTNYSKLSLVLWLSKILFLLLRSSSGVSFFRKKLIIHKVVEILKS